MKKKPRQFSYEKKSCSSPRYHKTSLGRSRRQEYENSIQSDPSQYDCGHPWDLAAHRRRYRIHNGVLYTLTDERICLEYVSSPYTKHAFSRHESSWSNRSIINGASCLSFDSIDKSTLLVCFSRRCLSAFCLGNNIYCFSLIEMIYRKCWMVECLIWINHKLPRDESSIWVQSRHVDRTSDDTTCEVLF